MNDLSLDPGMPQTERIWVSRMREIRTSGLKRAEVADHMACGY